MKNYDFQEKYFQSSDPIESYFECITTCDIRDGRCTLMNFVVLTTDNVAPRSNGF